MSVFGNSHSPLFPNPRANNPAARREAMGNDTRVGNGNLANELGGGLSASADGFGLDVSGAQIADYLKVDSSDRRMIERARGSDTRAYDMLMGDIAEVRGNTNLRAEREGQRAESELGAALLGQERLTYGDELSRNAFAAARTGQLGGSANRRREGRLYESSIQRRLDGQARAAQAGQAQRQQIYAAGQGIEQSLAQAAFMGADFDRAQLGAYQGTRPNMASPLSMQVEDQLAALALQSAADAAGVANAQDLVR